LKIYIAGRFSRQKEFLRYRHDLEAAGHTVTASWLDQEVPDENLSLRQAAKYAERDIADLKAADCIISFAEAPRAANFPRGGRHVEYGAAIALGKRLIVISYRENIFHFLPQVEFFRNWADCRRALTPKRRAPAMAEARA
jgi:nucleoside 2-deoxyribosyltransferase